jgi:putative hydrolase of the HAD superfamily
MNLSNIKAVFFDAADTLFFIREGIGNTYAAPARKYGIDPDPQELKKAFSIHFTSAPPLAFKDVSDNERKVLEKKWWYEVVRNVYNDIGMFNEFDDYFDDLFEVFRTSAWQIFPETINTLNEIKSMGFTIIVVSNFDSRVYDVCDNLGIIDHFDDFIISSEAGYAKPDVGIYNLALKKNNLNPEECVFIGDNYLNDYAVPTSIGMQAFLLNRENENDEHSVEKISNLNELLEILQEDGRLS